MHIQSNAMRARELARKIIPPHDGKNAGFYNAARKLVCDEVERQLADGGDFDVLEAAKKIRGVCVSGRVSEQTAAVIAIEALDAYDATERTGAQA